MEARLTLAGLCLVLGSCAGLEQWLNEPITGGAQLPQQPTVEVETPDGGEVTYSPPTPPAEPTNGDAIAAFVGNTVGIVGGNPGLGALAVGVLSAGLGALGRKKD